jgi:hypothetical protein
MDEREQFEHLDFPAVGDQAETTTQPKTITLYLIPGFY